MKLVLCLKYILDPELSLKSFIVEENVVIKKDLLHNISVFDESALEIALQLKDKDSNTKIFAVTAGPARSDEGLKRALAFHVDEVLRIDAVDDIGIDPSVTTELLSRGINHLCANFDLILLGRQSGDWDQSMVGQLLAEKANYPFISNVCEISLDDNCFIIKRMIDNQMEVIKAKPPLVVSVTNTSSNNLRYPKLKNVIRAKKASIPVFKSDKVRSAITLKHLNKVENKKNMCNFLSGDNEEQIDQLIHYFTKMGTL